MKIISPGSAYAPGQTPYDIFKDRMSAVSSIATGIKSMIANKYINNQLTMIADNILNKVDEMKSTELIGLITGKPPEEIYPDNLEDTIGQFVDKFAMGPMMQKETMMGGLAPEGLPTTGLPAPGPTTGVPTGETKIPTTSVNQFYKAISGMPSGDVNWANLYKTMSEKKPWFMGPTGPEDIVFQQMMKQVKDPREKIKIDLELAALAQETLYPKAEKPTDWDKRLDLFLQTDPTVDEVKKFVGGWIAPEKMSDFDKRFAAFMMTDPTVPEMKKFLGGYVAGVTPVDIQSIFENIPPGFELSSYNISATGAPSFSFKPIDKTTAWEFDTWDEAKAFLDTHPQPGFIGKIETTKGGFDVNFYKDTVDTVKALTASDIKSFNEMIYGKDQDPGIITEANYEKVKGYVESTKKEFPMPEYVDVAEANVARCLNMDGTVADIGLYSYFYKFYKDALKGKTPKYLPPELIDRTGFWKNKLGSALVEDYELDFAAMKRDGVTEEDIMKEIRERH